MVIEVKRILQGKNSTLSEIYMEGRFFCYGLEDAVQELSAAGSRWVPQIPAGSYVLGLNTYGAMHARYSRCFRGMHKGMLHILGMPDLKFSYIHAGTNFAHTSGGILVGEDYVKDDDGDYNLRETLSAYRCLYSETVNEMKKGKVLITLS